jgi:SNF2 family DNA or RNA helicase
MLVPVMNRAAAAALLSRNVKKRIALTATPIADRPRDLWAQLDTIEPNAHGNKTDWLTRYCDLKPGVYGGMDDRGESNIEELKMRLDVISHKVPAHVAHKHLLHKKRRQSVYLAPEDQTKPSAGFAKELKAAQKRGPTAVLEVRIAKAASKKRRAVIDMVDDHVGSGHKIVIFTGRRRDCDELGDRLRKARMGKTKNVQVWSAHGDHSVDVRQQIVDDYMAHPGPCVLVGTMQAFGQSINLDDTDAAFMVMLPYTPEMLRQAEGRFVRLSMKRAVVIYYVIAEATVDEHIASILIDKLPAVEEIADDQELGAARGVLAGIDENESEEDFAAAVLAALDE